jgi:hypothetical protein
MPRKWPQRLAVEFHVAVHDAQCYDQGPALPGSERGRYVGFAEQVAGDVLDGPGGEPGPVGRGPDEHRDLVSARDEAPHDFGAESAGAADHQHPGRVYLYRVQRCPQSWRPH